MYSRAFFVALNFLELEILRDLMNICCIEVTERCFSFRQVTKQHGISWRVSRLAGMNISQAICFIQTQTARTTN